METLLSFIQYIHPVERLELLIRKFPKSLKTMASELSKQSTILIAGGGTWGCSTALHLARRGYTDVTVLDVHPIPSPISAGNDVNKMVEQGNCRPNG